MVKKRKRGSLRRSWDGSKFDNNLETTERIYKQVLTPFLEGLTPNLLISQLLQLSIDQGNTKFNKSKEFWMVRSLIGTYWRLTIFHTVTSTYKKQKTKRWTDHWPYLRFWNCFRSVWKLNYAKQVRQLYVISLVTCIYISNTVGWEKIELYTASICSIRLAYITIARKKSCFSKELMWL